MIPDFFYKRVLEMTKNLYSSKNKNFFDAKLRLAIFYLAIVSTQPKRTKPNKREAKLRVNKFFIFNFDE